MGLFKQLHQMDLDRAARHPERAIKEQERKAKHVERKIALAAKKAPVVEAADLIEPLKKRGEKLFSDNLVPDEKVLVKLQGDSGQALVMTDKRLYVIKWGFMADQTFGGKCITYEYRQITALEFRKKISNRYIQILTPASPANLATSIWSRDKDGNNAKASDSVVTYMGNPKKDQQFQAAVNVGRQLISQAHAATAAPSTTPSHDDSLNKLERLAKLKERGLITEQEYTAKKRQLLGL